MAARGLRPETVELEFTESALVDDVDGAVATLRALRAKGFRIALDDFGTGYSALGCLRQLPFNTLKIDRSFVSDIVNEGESRVLVESILAMARAVGMTADAEGVERPEDAEMLRARGCAMLQGDLVSRQLQASERPLPPSCEGVVQAQGFAALLRRIGAQTQLSAEGIPVSAGRGGP
jgi:EAL domain-containing protein (putative c-di-GMP-specific phosphodiesterase class I)